MNKINSLKNHGSTNFVASDISEKHFQNHFQKKPATCNVTKNKSRFYAFYPYKIPAFKSPLQKHIQNRDKHLRWSFLRK